MWICIWGEPRTGKSDLALLIMFYIYKDWDKVLNAVAFSLNQILYKIKRGIPERWPTKNELHMRIPVLLWDDFGAHSNKAKTQFSMAWNYFKGGFDVLGTKMGVLMATMVSPSEPTQQIAEKYTHEIWIDRRGHYKYDRWQQYQDYRGFRAKGNKKWLDEQEFTMIPFDVFKQYDEMRQALADEVLIAIEDVIADTEVPHALKKLQPTDVNLLRLIERFGEISRYRLEEEMGSSYKEAVIRLKARNLIVPKEVSSKHYSYDMTDLGLEVLNAYNREKQTLKVVDQIEEATT